MRIRLAIFNHVNTNGRVYVAESKEEIQKLFNKSEYFLTGFSGDDNPDLNVEEKLKKSATVKLQDTVGIFKNLEIVETGDIGVGDLPIFEVYGELKVFENPGGKVFEESYNQNIVTIGMRSLGKKVDLYLPNFKIDKVICWDTIIR